MFVVLCAKQSNRPSWTLPFHFASTAFLERKTMPLRIEDEMASSAVGATLRAAPSSTVGSEVSGTTKADRAVYLLCSCWREGVLSSWRLP